MLQFIFGRPLSGKTKTVLDGIKTDISNNKSVVLIVPEQFSFESEKAVLKYLGDSATLSVSVMSFNRLFSEIGRLSGGIAGNVLADSDKIILMNKALNLVSSELKMWSRYSHSINFAKTMLSTIGELKINGIMPDDICKITAEINSVSLCNKMHDIELIYKTYDAIIGEKFLDPSDKLTKLYEKLKNFKFFNSKQVYFDSFKGFTGQQYKIIDSILAQADNVYISLTNNMDNFKEYDVFSNIRKCVQRIEKLARSHNVVISQPIVLKNSYYNSTSLGTVESLLATGDGDCNNNDNNVTLCVADTIYEEAEFVARTIRRLVRQENYRYRDFVIIARNADSYEESVNSACIKNHVNCFTDKRVTLAAFPAAVAVEAAIDAITSFSTEKILRFLKTGLGTLTYDEISIIENYTTLWNVTGKLWTSEWDMDLRGLTNTEDTKTEENAQLLNKINDMRVKAIDPIIHFKDNFKGTAQERAAAIVNLLDECNTSYKLNCMCNNFEEKEREYSSSILKQSYDMYMDTLDSIVRCFGNSTVKTKDFTDALNIAVSMTTVGSIPQALDEVMFGSADLMRPSKPKVAFILGANQGVFPAPLPTGGVLGINERKKLIELGIDISDNSVFAAIDENFLVYVNTCCASEKLFICCHAANVTGELAEPAEFFNNIKARLKLDTIYEHSYSLSSDNLPETKESAYSAFCRTKINEPCFSNTVLNGVSGTDTEVKIKQTMLKISKKDVSLHGDIAKKLYGKTLRISASKIENYNACHFSFFCRYGLKAVKIQPAELNNIQRGTIVHYVLERVVSTYKKKICTMNECEIRDIVNYYSDEYFSGIKGFNSVISPKHRLLIRNLKRTLVDVVWQLAREFEQSKFEPYACELKIGDESGIPALKIPVDDSNILITGSIDRVDTYKGYIRVIDYKTGTMNFKLPDVLLGLNLQMLIYLYSVIRGDKRDDSSAAGIFYMPAKRDISDKGMAMNGLMPGNLELITAMEADVNGKFIPKISLNKDNTIKSKSNSFIESKEFTTIFDYLEKIISKTGRQILNGDVAISPVDGDKNACQFCDYSAVCGIEQGEHTEVPKLKNEEVLEEMKVKNLNEI